MDYICYISRSKVDQLYAQVDPLDAGDVVSTSTTTSTFKASGDAGTPTLFSFLKAGLSYGRSNVLQTERKAKRLYTEKLAKLLDHLQGRNEILLFEQLLETECASTNYFSYVGDFKVTTPLKEGGALSAQVVTIESEFEGGKLFLDCSLRNFSDGNAQDGEFRLHSGNSSFFLGKLPLRFETVAILLSADKDVLYATPLYLVLRFPEKSSTSGIEIIAL